jgi:hypothetical protein
MHPLGRSDATSYQPAADLLRALAAPVRLALVDLLAEQA